MAAALVREDAMTELKVRCPEAVVILKEIGLYSFFPNKLSIHDVMKVGNESALQCTNDTQTSTGLQFFKRFIMLDHTARDRYYLNVSCESDDDDLLDTWTSDFETHRNSSDIFLLGFLCCDLRLRLLFLQKAQQCRIAIPLFYPKVLQDGFELLTWSLNALVLEWRMLDQESGITCMAIDALEADQHIITFCRLGEATRLSKSELMNSILTDEAYPSFTHRNCQVNTQQAKIADNIIEGSWYLPAGESSDIFSKLTMFLNVRGDLLKPIDSGHEPLIKQISNIIVIIIDASKIKVLTPRIHSILDKGYHTILLFDKSEGVSSIPGFKGELQSLQMDVSDPNTIQVVNTFNALFQSKGQAKLRGELRKALNRGCKAASLRKLSDFESFNSTGTNEYKQIVDKICKGVEDGMHSKSANSFPLQGTQWSKITQLQKKLIRISSSFLDDKMSREDSIKTTINAALEKQMKYCESPTEVVKLFLYGIQKANGRDKKQIHFFLQSLKTKLDSYLRKLETSQDIHFGLENVFREISLTYESAKMARYGFLRIDYSSLHVYYMLPQLMARIVLEGYPFEIMDGDVKNIPLHWVKAVLGEIEKSTGKQKVLVISVIGVQSSGKSTLLNSLFGLQMPVSDGRCTKGMFLQMIPVSDDNDLPYQHVCVLDTEGLRAPKLETNVTRFDNELVALTLGLADVTLVNVKGENYTEVKNVLQIAVLAFLRMKHVTKKVGRCLFIHQNVPSVLANVKSRKSSESLKTSLDEMIEEAAKQERLTEYTKFSDVIHFDWEKDVWHFPDLWHGDPPMSYVSKRYYNNVSSVRSNVLTDIYGDGTDLLYLDDLSQRIENLWHAILSDDFVFSFRNCLEVKVYLEMDNFCHGLVLDMETEFEDREKRFNESINQFCEECKIDTHRRETEKNISKLKKEMNTKFAGKLDGFVTDSSYATISKQWLENKRRYLESQIYTRLVQFKDNIRKYCKIQILRSTILDPHFEKVRHKVLSLAADEMINRKNWDADRIKDAFSKVWNECKDDCLISEGMQNVALDISKLLKESLTAMSKSFGVISKQSQEKTREIDLRTAPKLDRLVILSSGVVESNYNYHKSVMERVKNAVHCGPGTVIDGFSDEPLLLVKEKVRSVLKKIEDDLNDMKGRHVQCTKMTVERLLAYLKPLAERPVTIDQHMRIIFTADYLFELSVKICHISLGVLYQMHMNYENRYGLSGAIESYRHKLQNLFTSACSQIDEKDIAFNIFFDTLETRLKSFIANEAFVRTKRHIFKYFGRKVDLLRNILQELCENEDFNAYNSFLNNPDYYALRWLRTQGARLCKGYIQHIATDMTSLVITICQDSVITLTDASITMAHLMISFCNALNTSVNQKFKGKLKLKPNDFNVAETVTPLCELSMSVIFVKATFDKRFPHFKHNIDSWADSTKPIWSEQHADELSIRCLVTFYDQIFNRIWGCPEQCPFCKEPCRMSTPHHATSFPHECLQHRPRGVRGLRWLETRQLVLETCHTSINSNEAFASKEQLVHQEYSAQKAQYPNWKIKPDLNYTSASSYWLWFMSRFCDDLSKEYVAAPSEVPSSWRNITKERALESLLY